MFGFLSKLCCCMMCFRNNEKRPNERRCAVFILYIINLAFMVVGFMILLGGLIGSYSPRLMTATAIYLGYDAAKAALIEEWVDKGAVAFFWLGSGILLYGSIGFVGTFTKNTLLLFAYRLVFLMLILTECAFSVILLFLPSKLQAIGLESMQKSLLFYQPESKEHPSEPLSGIVTQAWNKMQFELNCCGVSNYTDFVSNHSSLPSSCCHSNSTSNATLPSHLCHSTSNPYLNEKGCYEVVVDLLSTIKWKLMKYILPLILVQLNLLVMTYFV